MTEKSSAANFDRDTPTIMIQWSDSVSSGIDDEVERKALSLSAVVFWEPCQDDDNDDDDTHELSSSLVVSTLLFVF